MLPLSCRPNSNVFPDYVKLIGYFDSAVNFVSSNPCVGALPRIKIAFPLLLICTDELIPAPKVMTFFPKISSVNKVSERESNHML